ncbi:MULTISPECIES: tRNA (adenosine(37)-N6)-dimethylallyltransferase MiaA [unclassified Thioalkalivibrio]|uniref:tRNA (adenosine(37)-N6)-dimethylallyltransferase MiaA n=1 Tax=unclassified Thioalkalivibrio TaxID=2621013 RepID=UPI0003749C61|nr:MULTISPECIES: tRNA (adenosine(37)-N6)-dimethylallyltransferase MiaA [unclassified Thioalkalivibrio]
MDTFGPGRPPVVILAGPTASGKTALSLALAEALEGEIISVDSALVYRGMDIGTAKPIAEERARVPHHLLDIRDPEDTYSAADFAHDAEEVIAGIHARGRVALLVGGTLLYLRALLDGFDEIPEVPAPVRERVRARLDVEGGLVLHRELANVDPEAAARIHPNDPQRILRALEVFEATGRPLSSFQKGAAARVPKGWVSMALWPEDRDVLRERIAQRFDAMLEAGFVDELMALQQRPGLTAEHPSQRAVGYRQGWQWLAGELGFAQFRERAIAATRQLAKRQLTGLRRFPLHARLNASTVDRSEVLNVVRHADFDR